VHDPAFSTCTVTTMRAPAAGSDADPLAVIETITGLTDEEAVAAGTARIDGRPEESVQAKTTPSATPISPVRLPRCLWMVRIAALTADYPRVQLRHRPPQGSESLGTSTSFTTSFGVRACCHCQCRRGRSRPSARLPVAVLRLPIHHPAPKEGDNPRGRASPSMTAEAETST
jgi:hypothetical protein